MQVELTYNKADVLQALRYHFITRKEIRLMVIIVNVFALVSAGLFFFHKISPMAFLISSLLWFSMMFMFWLWLPRTIYRRNATFKDHFTLSMQDNHMSIQNERGSKSWAWREFSEYLESPKFFHLYFNPRSFFLVPKDAFGGVEAVHEARMILKGKIKRGLLT
jgi:hypothetical protein